MFTLIRADNVNSFLQNDTSLFMRMKQVNFAALPDLIPDL
jgi:hypothetical protein